MRLTTQPTKDPATFLPGTLGVRELPLELRLKAGSLHFNPRMGCRGGSMLRVYVRVESTIQERLPAESRLMLLRVARPVV